MCLENTLYRLSFPTEEMSIDDMERASMGPKRWETIVNEYTDQPTPPTHITTLSDEFLEDDIRKPQELFLVPGGRFLASLLMGYLSLWDLGYASVTIPRLMGRRWMDTAVCTFHPSSDGSAIKFLVIPSHLTVDPSK